VIRSGLGGHRQYGYLVAEWQEQIKALVADAAEQLQLVDEMYEESLEEQSVSPRLQTRIKNVVENQRSALEYLANRIYEAYGDGKRAKSYFPVAESPEDFPRVFDLRLPGVAAGAAEVRAAIEERQPYRDGYGWLQDLVYLTNENKHRKLTAQTRKERSVSRWNRPEATIEADDAGNIRIGPPAGDTNVRFEGDLREIPPDEELAYVDWLFTDLGKSAMQTLQAIQAGTVALIEEVVAVMDQVPSEG